MEKNLILQKAKSAEMSHDFNTAARMYKQLLDDDASNVDYLKALGSIYVQAGEDEKAIPYYEQIIAYYPHYIEAMNSLGAIYRRLKRYEESINILQKALDEDRQVPSVNYNLGFTYKEMENYDDAIDAFNSVISVNPNDVLAHNHLGTIYLSLKEYQKSIASFKHGLQIDPNHPILNYNLARCYEASKNFPDAIRCYGLTLKTKPGWTDAVKDFSNLLIKCQKNKEAQELVQQTIKLHPDDINLLCLLGKIFLCEFDYDQAVRTYKAAKEKKPEDTKVLYGLADAYDKAGKTMQAMDVVLDGLDIDSNNTDLRKLYARCLLNDGNLEEAWENIQILYSSETGKEDLQVLDLMGQYYVSKGDEAKAKELYSKIKQLNHHYKDFWLGAAKRFATSENWEKAEEYANKYVEQRPQNPDGYMSLGLIYEQKGDYIGAKNFFGKSLSLRDVNVLAKQKISMLTDKLNDLDMYVPLQEIDPNEIIEEAPLEPIEETIETPKETSENEDFDFAQMGGDAPSEEPENKDYFETLANNVEDTYAKEEDEDTFEIQDPDKFDFADEETSFDFDQKEEDEDPLTHDDEADFFGRDSESIAKAEQAIEEALPEMTKMQENAKDSADMAREASEKAQKLMEQLQEQQAMMQEQMLAQQELMNEQMKHNAQNMVKEAVCDFLETTPEPEPVKNSENVPVTEAVPASESEPAQEFVQEPALDSMPETEEPVEESVEESAEDDFSVEDFLPKTITAEDEEEEEEKDDLDLSFDEEFSSSLNETPEIEVSPVVIEEAKDDNDDSWFEDSIEEEVESPVAEEITAEEITDEGTADTEITDTEISDTEISDTEITDTEITVEEMLEKIQRILKDDEVAQENAEKLELFRTLRILCNFLPESEKNTFESCRMRMMIEYIIEKLSGKPGLLKTTQSLLKSGVLGPEYESQLTKDCEQEMGNELIRKVIIDMKKLSDSLEDKALAKSLSITADGILEQIELKNQKAAIF